MFVHNKEMQFEIRVERPDPRFANLLQEQFGGENGELKAAMQYFTQAFLLRRKNPKMYDLFMDIATEELSHLEMVGSLITLLLDGLNDDLQVALNPLHFIETGGGPHVSNAAGTPFTGAYINANGDPSVDLRSNLGAESRAKVVYEYLKQFTDDPGVQDTLTFLMTREVTHFQQFTAALNELPVNFPPGQAPGDERFQNVAFNMSEGETSRGPWNQGQGPWPKGIEWEYVKSPTRDWLGGSVRQNRGPQDIPDGSPAVQSEKPFAHEQHSATG